MQGSVQCPAPGLKQPRQVQMLRRPNLDTTPQGTHHLPACPLPGLALAGGQTGRAQSSAGLGVHRASSAACGCRWCSLGQPSAEPFPAWHCPAASRQVSGKQAARAEGRGQGLVFSKAGPAQKGWAGEAAGGMQLRPACALCLEPRPAIGTLPVLARALRPAVSFPGECSAR